ncbi:D-inositol-3-phosphate glycosyltransferase [Cellulomonas sp. T2.31MG-18]|uniref:glycosyltransferase family 4 protein n=1 Tax=Cellulomonas sp. T2.31MG-18 TaxID=3157619 RepID=UPI0035EF6B4B
MTVLAKARRRSRTPSPAPVRMALLATTLEGHKVEAAHARTVLEAHLTTPRDDVVWLTLAVLSGALPTADEVVTARRAARFGGPQAVIDAAMELGHPEDRAAIVEVVSGPVIDIEHLARTSLGTGIQRVTRETMRHWVARHDLHAAGWHLDHRAMRPLTAPELGRALGGSVKGRPSVPHPPKERRVLVPWQATYVLPEVVLEEGRTRRMQALLRFSRSRGAAIGFDTVPLTSAETAADDVPPRFVLELAALRHAHRIATISGAAACEYEGWRTMVRSMGLEGPEIREITLAVEAVTPDPAALAEASARYCVPTLPMVLCVGSHEPRKNHLAVLHAAERLWRDGVEFSLVFVGGNAWKSEGFSRRLAELAAAGRPVESVLGLSDRLLWALYALARCTVFPSLNEGFGLPVAESLASGTPVVTSSFGSMLEIAEGGGALTVDPRDDAAVASAMRALLTDDVLHHELVAQARGRAARTWQQYAEETWQYLVATNR